MGDVKCYQISLPHKNKSLVFGDTDIENKQTSDEQKKKKVVGMGR